MMRARHLSFAVALACGLLGTRARAYDACGVYDSIPGTVSYQVAKQAVASNANVYSAVALLERQVLPKLNEAGAEDDNDYDDTLAVWALDYNLIYGATSVPATARTGSGYGCAQNGIVDVDLAAGNLAYGLRYKSLSVFYAAGTATSYIPPMGLLGRAYLPVFPLVGWGYGLVAPLLGAGSTQKDVYSLTWDYVAGANVRTDVVSVSAGYVGSTGLYGHVVQPDIAAQVSSVVTDEFHELALLKGGFAQLDWLVPEDTVEAIGSTAVYARHMQQLIPPSRVEQSLGTSREDLGRVSLLTGHLEQNRVAEYFDLLGAVKLGDRVDLHDAAIGVHFTKKAMEREWYDPDNQARLIVGVVKVPDQYYLGLQGGYRLRLGLEISSEDKETRSKEHRLSGSLTLNDPEFLAVFPYAQNAVQFNIVYRGWED